MNQRMILLGFGVVVAATNLCQAQSRASSTAVASEGGVAVSIAIAFDGSEADARALAQFGGVAQANATAHRGSKANSVANSNGFASDDDLASVPAAEPVIRVFPMGSRDHVDLTSNQFLRFTRWCAQQDQNWVFTMAYDPYKRPVRLSKSQLWRFAVCYCQFSSDAGLKCPPRWNVKIRSECS